MRGWWHDRITTAPLWALFLGSAGYFGAVLLFAPGMGPRWFTGAIFLGLAFGTWMTAFVAVTCCRDQVAAGPLGIPDRVVIARALRTGELPIDEALDQPLLSLIERRRRQLRWASKVYPWLFGGLAVVGLVTVVAEHDAVSLLYVVLYLAVLVYLRRSSVRGAARLYRLESAIRHRSSQ